jgi:hypothetical protein
MYSARTTTEITGRERDSRRSLRAIDIITSVR